MRLFIIIYFGLLMLSTLFRIFLLGLNDYPRSVSRGNDAWALAIGIGFLMWAGYLLWVR